MEKEAQARSPDSLEWQTRQNEYLLDFWHRDDAVARFAQRLSELLGHSIARDASKEEVTSWIKTGLARRLGLPEGLPTRTLTLELDRLAGIAADDVFNSAYVTRTEVAVYAQAIRATRKAGLSHELTPLGRVFLELSGRDTIRWLLHIEAAQATGNSDPWRLSRNIAHLLLKNCPWTLTWNRSPSIVSEPFLSWVALHRLKALGLLSIRDQFLNHETTLDLSQVGHELLMEIANEEESPMSLLASSLIDDLTRSAIELASGSGNQNVASAHASAAAEATARQARLVAHELRNVLVPVKTTLSALYREVLLAPPGEAIGRRRESIDKGLDAAFRFIEQLVKVSALGAVPTELFDPSSAIRDAVSSITEESGLPIETSLPKDLPPVTGHRARFVLAISNLLRNAAQAVAPESPQIRLLASSIENARAVLITIDDNGPGVPENMRQAIFNEGVFLRPGGSGLGLALVREVFEKEMKGLVGCTSSPLGGARFVLRVPTTGLERR
ncbi:sensor histidine kinase [Hyalangium versicolor]|uniref:sensor histidine kinase n=1 Tax=Hyalangium versicolor TaxID=2861190 RepID=UPI001CCB3978|nr:HAMP domain-containing sensor histidine kinase [Hyalangium versicolor]